MISSRKSSESNPFCSKRIALSAASISRPANFAASLRAFFINAGSSLAPFCIKNCRIFCETPSAGKPRLAKNALASGL
ncbi:MAG: hypothetical protein HDR33_02230 [Treponema sp.]|nr:hypothetical protein [Treponema sp.]